MKDKIIFIAHSFHKKTRSCDFMVNYLAEFFDVELLFDEAWETGNRIDWSLIGPEYKAVIIWQMFPNQDEFSQINNKNIIYFPMYDHVFKWDFKKWYECRDVKIISFSSILHKKLKKWGFNSTYIQYFVEPKEFMPGKADEVFFWQRHTKINIKSLKRIFKNSDIKIHIHKTVDPGHEFIQPSIEDEKRFDIKYSEWFNDKSEMEKLMLDKGIYIAPRQYEGIGMSFLEAMACGKLVIAHNAPTMNEYIKSGKNGILCDFRLPRPVNLKNIEQMQKNAHALIKNGYEKWLISRGVIIDRINEQPQGAKFCLGVKAFLPVLLLDRKKIIRFKLGKNACLVIGGKDVLRLWSCNNSVKKINFNKNNSIAYWGPRR